jgi:hypothetical protein
MTQVLKDIGVDILALGPANESESPFDYHGVEFLAMTILTGLSNWLQKLDHTNWPIQHWFDSFVSVFSYYEGVYNVILCITLEDEYSPGLALQSSSQTPLHLQLVTLRISCQLAIKMQS